MTEQIVVFEDWERVMKETVPVALQGAYREAVVKFRYWLREKGEAISNITAVPTFERKVAIRHLKSARCD